MGEGRGEKEEGKRKRGERTGGNEEEEKEEGEIRGRRKR